MNVANLLKRKKNSAVLTVRPEDTIMKLAQLLRVEDVGAMIVSHDGTSVDGIISERDIVRALAVDEGRILSLPVSSLMTTGVVTCSPDDSIADIAHLMTEHRVRHVPVRDARHRLVGIVSIGDVLKHRVDEVQFEATVLRDIAIAAR
jgi:CBS domain-containing protein